jgi:hypothetical protein
MTKPAHLAHRLTLDLAEPGTPRIKAIAKIRAALVDAHGNQTRAAADLGVPARTLRRWLARPDLADLRDASTDLRVEHGVSGPRAEREKPAE